MANFVMDYWQTYRQIPVDGELKQLRKKALDVLPHDLRIYLKDDKEVAQFLNGCVVTTINRQLKAEKCVKTDAEQSMIFNTQNSCTSVKITTFALSDEKCRRTMKF